jgi:hypothetical protein
MNDEVLARARKLAEAANMVAAQMSQQAHDFEAVSIQRQNHAQEDLMNKQKIENELNNQLLKIPTISDLGSCRTFQGAVIHGSSLINTYNDIRYSGIRGGTIVIDGHECNIATKGEWTATCIALEKGVYINQIQYFQCINI